jgi:hypothetical protein
MFENRIQLYANELGPSLNRNWNDATSLIELDICDNNLTSIDNLPFDRMSRLLTLDVLCVVCVHSCAIIETCNIVDITISRQYIVVDRRQHT